MAAPLPDLDFYQLLLLADAFCYALAVPKCNILILKENESWVCLLMPSA